MCDKSKCCQSILEIYPETYRYFEAFNPTNINLASLLACLELYLAPVYEATKTGKVFCCKGIVEAINKTIKIYIKLDSEDAGNFYVTMNGILIQAGFAIPTSNITIRKTLTPPDDSGRFIYYLNDKLVGPAEGISNKGSIILKDLPLGNYSIREAGAPGTSIVDYVVTNSINSGPIQSGRNVDFTLNCGSDTICDFFNEKGGSAPCADVIYCWGYIDPQQITVPGDTWSAFANVNGQTECGTSVVGPPVPGVTWNQPSPGQVEYKYGNQGNLIISMIVDGYILGILQNNSVNGVCLPLFFTEDPVKSFTIDPTDLNLVIIWYYYCPS